MTGKSLPASSQAFTLAARTAALGRINAALMAPPTQLSAKSVHVSYFEFDARVLSLRHEFAEQQDRVDEAVLDAGVAAYADNQPLTIIPWSVCREWIEASKAGKAPMLGCPELVDMWIADTVVLVLERARKRGVKLPA
jgi:hypothetical protein